MIVKFNWKLHEKFSTAKSGLVLSEFTSKFKTKAVNNEVKSQIIYYMTQQQFEIQK
jgi:hypothetical protein